MFDSTKPYALRNGLQAEILGTIAKQTGFRYAVRCTQEDGYQFLITTNLVGHCFNNVEHPEDLVNIKTKHTGYVGIYSCAAYSPEKIHSVHIGSVFKNRADVIPSASLITITEISWEE